MTDPKYVAVRLFWLDEDVTFSTVLSQFLYKWAVRTLGNKYRRNIFQWMNAFCSFKSEMRHSKPSSRIKSKIGSPRNILFKLFNNFHLICCVKDIFVAKFKPQFCSATICGSWNQVHFIFNRLFKNLSSPSTQSCNLRPLPNSRYQGHSASSNIDDQTFKLNLHTDIRYEYRQEA